MMKSRSSDKFVVSDNSVSILMVGYNYMPKITVTNLVTLYVVVL